MALAHARESGQLVLELHGVLQEIDPARWKAGSFSSQGALILREKLRALQARLRDLLEPPWPDDASALRLDVVELSRTLSATLPHEDSTEGTPHTDDLRRRWIAFRQAVAPSYERLKASLGGYAIHVPSLRPTNVRRSITHAIMGVVCVSILWAIPNPWWALAITLPLALWAWTAEITRRRSARVNALLMRFFAPIAHPHEHHGINSATWYSTALLILTSSLFVWEGPAVPQAVGLAVLAFGDPAAAAVGRRFGWVRIAHGRTLSGTLAFVVVGALAGLAAAYAFAPAMAFGHLVAIASAGAVSGAVTEVVSRRIDDNLSVPLVATLGAAIAALLV
ncbi:MAG: diacylglycerol/polyprenol kinase family protein [Sandaracinaceae bacterium]